MKSFMRVMMGTAVLAVAVMAAPVTGQAYSYNAWVGMTGAKTVAVNPFYSFSLSAPYSGSLLAKFDYGFTDHADIFVDITSGYIMPRFDLLKNNAAILGVYLGSGPGLQVHGFFDESDILAIEYNVGLTTSAWDFSGIDAFAIIAPTLKLGDFGVWVEADFNSIISGFGFDMGAGVYLNVGDNQISLGVNSILGSPYIGGWLWAPFSFN